ncbi:hypothetical protein LISE100100_00290 [Listeria seeligeri]|uniref:hypothetical protein n=1 Tax=Listeria seeligeri TaxID=1640 RepID=UPI0001C4EC7E|nr:hypothetical protein [Listeria seeligeri]CBH27766.1 hypothetical protein lse_1615 [Listeria seeligeri serovar 1/2b str. SLCC3954]
MKNKDYYIVRVGEMLLFQKFEDTTATFQIDDQPGTESQAEKFDDLEEAKKVAEVFGGEVVNRNE